MGRLLADRLHHAQNEGMSEGAVNNLAFQIGDYLASQVEPKMSSKEFFQIYGLLQTNKNNKLLPI